MAELSERVAGGESRGAKGRGQVVRLPTEAEWEYAARGTAGRTYPWSDDALTPERANYDEHIGRPTAVGCYPAGATPGTGIFDLAGNVWEWCADEWKKGRSARVLRGGAWDYQPHDVVCADRDYLNPVDLINYFGFRCART